jgi:5-methylcytosine-specific restriction endonuclease McrA
VLSRDIPNDVQRTVSRRDGGRCAYTAPDGTRCTERTFLQFHHLHPYALGGLPTVDNISLRCRRHNQYEAEIVVGRHERRSKDVGSVVGRPRET